MSREKTARWRRAVWVQMEVERPGRHKVLMVEGCQGPAGQWCDPRAPRRGSEAP